MITPHLDLQSWLQVRAWVEPGAIPSGGSGLLVVEAEIPSGCHIQAHDTTQPFVIPLALTLEPASDVELGSVTYPPAEEQGFSWSPVVLQVYHGTVRMEAPLEVVPGADPGVRHLSGALRYQGCTPEACLMPATQPVAVTLEVGLP